MLIDVVVFSPGSAAMWQPGIPTSSIFNTQHVATRRNWVAKRMQHVAPNNVCDLLRSFGWSLQMLGQQCWGVLR